jgi:hypothetical protein
MTTETHEHNGNVVPIRQKGRATPAPLPQGPHAVVVLGERSYVVTPPTWSKEEAWRDALTEPVRAIIGLMNQWLGQQNGTDTSTAVDALKQIDLSQLIAQFESAVLGMPSLVFEAVLSYAPAIEADREYIREHAYSYQLYDALWKIVQLAYPLGQVVKMFSGPTVSSTSKN